MSQIVQMKATPAVARAKLRAVVPDLTKLMSNAPMRGMTIRAVSMVLGTGNFGTGNRETSAGLEVGEVGQGGEKDEDGDAEDDGEGVKLRSPVGVVFETFAAKDCGKTDKVHCPVNDIAV